MTPDKPQQATPKLPDTVPEAPVFGQPTTKKPKSKPAFATYLGPNAAPSLANGGTGKTLIGT